MPLELSAIPLGRGRSISADIAWLLLERRRAVDKPDYNLALPRGPPRCTAESGPPERITPARDSVC